MIKSGKISNLMNMCQITNRWGHSLCVFSEKSLSLFLSFRSFLAGQVMSPHHTDQRSHVSSIFLGVTNYNTLPLRVFCYQQIYEQIVIFLGTPTLGASPSNINPITVFMSPIEAGFTIILANKDIKRPFYHFPSAPSLWLNCLECQTIRLGWTWKKWRSVNL